MIDGLKKSAEEIKMTDEAKKRMIKNIELKTSDKEEFVMKKIRFKKMMPLVAIIAILAFSVSAVVITHFRGFNDVVKNGAVVDTVFNEETEMIEIEAVAGDNLVVTASILDYQSVPYTELDAIESIYYNIYAGEDTEAVVEKGLALSTSEFADGIVTFEVPLDNIPAGEYRLVIREFVGTKKADKPLPIRGLWECAFTKQ